MSGGYVAALRRKYSITFRFLGYAIRYVKSERGCANPFSPVVENLTKLIAQKTHARVRGKYLMYRHRPERGNDPCRYLLLALLFGLVNFHVYENSKRESHLIGGSLLQR